MKVKDIIPFYMNAKNKLESEGIISTYVTDISHKYMNNFMYDKTKPTILLVINNVLSTLMTCNPDSKWISD